MLTVITDQLIAQRFRLVGKIPRLFQQIDCAWQVAGCMDLTPTASPLPDLVTLQPPRFRSDDGFRLGDGCCLFFFVYRRTHSLFRCLEGAASGDRSVSAGITAEDEDPACIGRCFG